LNVINKVEARRGRKRPTWSVFLVERYQ
jgi:hypothetical protein